MLSVRKDERRDNLEKKGVSIEKEEGWLDHFPHKAGQTVAAACAVCSRADPYRDFQVCTNVRNIDRFQELQAQQRGLGQ